MEAETVMVGCPAPVARAAPADWLVPLGYAVMFLGSLVGTLTLVP